MNNYTCHVCNHVFGKWAIVPHNQKEVCPICGVAKTLNKYDTKEKAVEGEERIALRPEVLLLEKAEAQRKEAKRVMLRGIIGLGFMTVTGILTLPTIFGILLYGSQELSLSFWIGVALYPVPVAIIFCNRHTIKKLKENE